MDISENSKNQFVENLKSKRIDRQYEKEKEQKRLDAATLIQKTFRGYITRKKFRRDIL
jgi:IQ calmodulin-binding motif